MMSGFSMAVCFAVLSTVRAGNVAPSTNLSLSVGQLLQEVRSMKHSFTSLNQTMTSQFNGLKGTCTCKQQPVPYRGSPTASRLELQAIQSRLNALDIKLKAKLESTQATLRTLQSNLKSGSTYVRWGRKSCSNASQLVYSGIAGGSWYDHSGGAANPLCLTLTPQTGGTHLPAHYIFLYGAEYQYFPNHHDHDVPCSVCLAPQPTTIMIPATHTCPNGWTTQYRGYLSAGYYTHVAASQYVCLDKDLENAPGGHMNKDGYLFYMTVTRCGSLPCPPYTNNQIVLCVVCSK